MRYNKDCYANRHFLKKYFHMESEFKNKTGWYMKIDKYLISIIT